MNLTYHEIYGTVSKPQLSAYKKFNVSQYDHDELVIQLGEDNHEGITAEVKACSPNGYYVAFNPHLSGAYGF